MKRQMGRRVLSGVCGCLLVLLVAVAAGAQAPPQIQGTTTRITSDPATHFGPASSANFVCYTELQSAQEVFCYDRATNKAFQVTTATGITTQTFGDLSGNNLVYTETGAISAVKMCVLDPTTDSCAAGSPFAVSSSGAASAPSVDGSLVAWQDTSTGNTEIWAKDLSSGALAQLTNRPGSPSTAANVSGRTIVYSTSFNPTCQIFATNFDTLVATQITNSATGCNVLPDISGNHVVYQGNRDGNQDIYVYDLSTNRETRIPLPGIQQNAHVSGDWVTFEDLSTTNISSIRLYQISSGRLFTAVEAASSMQAATLNDIDGHNIVYNSEATGQLDIYLFRFNAEIPFSSFSALVGITLDPQDFGVAGSFTLGSGAAVNLATDSVTLQLGGFSTTIPGGSLHPGLFGIYGYQGTINGVTLSVAILPRSAGTFVYVISGKGAAGLPTANPVNVGLTVGDNSGNASVTALILRFGLQAGG